MRENVFACVIAFSLCTATIFAQENHDITPESKGQWTVKHADSKKIYAIQCGLDVTLFVLKYFNVDYSIGRVSKELPLSEKGISLASIQETLRAYGLHTSAKTEISLEQVAEQLNGNFLAIIPLSLGNGRNHYYVAMMDNKGDVQLVNVQKGVSPLVSKKSQEYNKLHKNKFVQAGGVVLFVSKLAQDSHTKPIADSIEVIPKKIELGEFMVSGPEAPNKIETSLQLVNPSDSSILVTTIQTSCGCTKLRQNYFGFKVGGTKTPQC